MFAVCAGTTQRQAMRPRKAARRHNWHTTGDAAEFNEAVVLEWRKNPAMRARMDVPVWVFLRKMPHLSARGVCGMALVCPSPASMLATRLAMPNTAWQHPTPCAGSVPA